MELLHSGKVRDVYADGDDLILVASDRISIYDVALPTPIPDKGRLLTALSLWWFEQLADLVPNHVVSATDVPEEFAGRAIRCRRLEMVPVECVARGYLTGGGFEEYRRTGAVSGVELPRGLVEASILPEPIFTPSTKAPKGEHDEPITYAQVVDKLGAETAARLRQITIDVYRRGAEIAAERGILIADTKIELGWTPDGSLILADELLTSDSSRFWPAESYQPGRAQFSYDKQYVRDWATGSGWDRQPPAPEVPAEVVEATRARYVESTRSSPATAGPESDAGGTGSAVPGVLAEEMAPDVVHEAARAVGRVPLVVLAGRGVLRPASEEQGSRPVRRAAGDLGADEVPLRFGEESDGHIVQPVDGGLDEILQHVGVPSAQLHPHVDGEGSGDGGGADGGDLSRQSLRWTSAWPAPRWRSYWRSPRRRPPPARRPRWLPPPG